MKALSPRWLRLNILINESENENKSYKFILKRFTPILTKAVERRQREIFPLLLLELN